MRNLLILTTLILLPLASFSQMQLEWQKSFGGSSMDECYSMEATSDGGFILVGYVSSPNDGDVIGNDGLVDVWAVKLDSAGTMVWQSALGGTQPELAFSIVQTADGGYVFAGRTESSNGDCNGVWGQYDFWVVKLDALGNLLWEQSYGTPYADIAYSIIEISSGGFMAVGWVSTAASGDVSVSYGASDFWVIRLDAMGNLIWEKSYGGASDDRAQAIRETTSGNFIIAGYTNSWTGGMVTGHHGGSDAWIIEIDGTGNLLWQNCLGGTGGDIAFDIELTSDGGYIVAGHSGTANGDVSLNFGSHDYWVIKLNALGNIEWEHSYGGTDFEEAYDVEQTADGGYIVTGKSWSPSIDLNQNNGASDVWTIKIDSLGNIITHELMGGSQEDEGFAVTELADGKFIVAGFSESSDGDVTFNNGYSDFWIASISTPNIVGGVYFDGSQNCIQDQNENGIEGINLIINPGNIVVTTNEFGLWWLDSLPIGSYTVLADTTTDWAATCSPLQNFTITDPSLAVSVPRIALYNDNPCASPDVSITMPFIRPCFTNQLVYVSVANDPSATGILAAPTVYVSLDTALTVTSASIPYTDLGNNLFSFYGGYLNPGESTNFTISTTVSCDAILEQTVCMDVELFQADSCFLDGVLSDTTVPYGGNLPGPCTAPWGKSDLTVTGWCEYDSIHFTVTNIGPIGIGDMNCYAPVWITVNGIVLFTDSILLMSGQSATYSFPGNGQTWIFNAAQHPQHPGNSNPSAFVEACGNIGNWTPDLVNNFPLDDSNPNVDIFCGPVTGSYDPNDKTGYPTGVTSDHFIEANEQLEYVVRFQNTGTDTAFTVVVRDTLDFDLNIFTVTPGVASHPYSFQMYGPRVLEWTFDNILLVDSTTNEPGSNGFLTFKVDQLPNLSPGTTIENEADIYFDFNAPIITNTTLHTIYEPTFGGPNSCDPANGFDLSAPTAICQDITIELDSSGMATNVGWAIDAGSTDNCSIVEWITTPSIFTCADLGDNPTQLMVIDPSGNSSTCSSVVHIIDSGVGGAPVPNLIQLPELTDNCSVTPDIPQATDACEGIIDGVTSTPFPIITIGTTLVNWTFTDSQGNTSTQLQTVTITGIDPASTLSQDGGTISVNPAQGTYQWIDCSTNSPILGAINPSFTPTINGEYAVIISSGNCADTSDCVTISTAHTDTKNISLTIHPNPSRDGKFTVTTDVDITAIEVIDLLGRRINVPVDLSLGIVDASELAPGKYLLNIETNLGPHSAEISILR